MKHLMSKTAAIAGVLFSIIIMATLLLPAQYGIAQSVPQALETIVGEDGSHWERVSEPGFGDANNVAVVSLCLYQDDLYALVRNEASGFQIWKTQGTSWEQVSVPGFTDGTLHEFMFAIYGKLIEFQDSLYVAVGSGYEGAYLYGSVGCEMWRFDGQVWEAVVSNSKDADEGGTISSISGCSAGDGDTTAEITDGSKSWTADQWQGGVLRITSGEGKGRVFNIVGNTPTTFIVQQNEAANTELDDGSETEYTICDSFIPDEDYPNITAGAVSAGDSYEIGMGEDENGFGEIWNKNFLDMIVLDDELYAGISHNYEDGTKVWKTANGETWMPTSDYAFGNFHGYDLDGNPTNVCLIEDYEHTVGNPVCSSATHFGKSSVGGTETLYVGGTGSTGCNGRAARALRLEDGEWQFIVDNFVDANDEGTNENGFGNSSSFLTANFQAWTWAEYDDVLFLNIARTTGSRIMYTETGGPEDGAWSYAVGGDSGVPDGFDGAADFIGYGANIAANLFVYDSALYAGTLMVKRGNPLPFISPVFDGADIWRATGPAESLVWNRITGDGFGAGEAIQHFEGFCTFDDTLYLAASNRATGNPFTAGTPLPENSGAKIYRLKAIPRIAHVSAFAGEATEKGIMLTWETDTEFDCVGFNIHRSSSEKMNTPYKKRNCVTIEPTGSPTSGGTYTFTDRVFRSRATLFYKIECVNSGGQSKFVGPLGVTIGGE